MLIPRHDHKSRTYRLPIHLHATHALATTPQNGVASRATHESKLKHLQEAYQGTNVLLPDASGKIRLNAREVSTS